MERIIVMGIVFLVDLLLLTATARMGKEPIRWGRYLVSAFLGACIAAASLLPGAELLRTWWVHILTQVCIALSAYGFHRGTLLNTALFLLLKLSLGQVSAGGQALAGMLLGAVGISLGCLLLRQKESFVPVELTYRDKHLRIRALVDTGNQLTDPVTGCGVLVVSAEVARELTGLTSAQLEDPVATMGAIPGLRLIPYHTVGNTGFLLALQLHRVRIGNRQGSTLVAFSPRQLGLEYEALTGGML